MDLDKYLNAHGIISGCGSFKLKELLCLSVLEELLHPATWGALGEEFQGQGLRETKKGEQETQCVYPAK